jgi:hypothetical protein
LYLVYYRYALFLGRLDDDNISPKGGQAYSHAAAQRAPTPGDERDPAGQAKKFCQINNHIIL